MQPGGPPLVAGVNGPKALARAARWASGVSYPNAILDVDAGVLDAQRLRVIEAWKEAGRETAPHFSACTWFALGANAEEQLKGHVWAFMRVFGEDQARSMAENAQGFGPGALRAAVAAARDGGLDELFLVPTTADAKELDRASEALGL